MEFKTLKEILPDGEWVFTPFKEVFKLKNRFNPSDKIGEIKISDIFNYKENFKEFLSILGKSKEYKNFEFDKILFLDVESTGYKFSAGNLIFLIGIGYFSKDKFIIEQYFIEDPLNEMGLLFIIESFFKERNHIITYNGKSFDFYAIRDRFIFSNKFELKLSNAMNFDLLHSSRRLWGDLFEYLGLQTLEKKFLKFNRSDDDVPGYLIPEYYKNYLKFRNASYIKNIFYHNLMDVLSMLGILVYQFNIVKMILNYEYPENINYVRTAELFKTIDKKIYKDLLLIAFREGERESLKPLYNLYKKEKDFDKSYQILNLMLESEREFDYFPYKELCIYYERVEKSKDKAIDILKKALKNIGDLSLKENEKIVDDIIKRLDRLKKGKWSFSEIMKND